MERSLKFLVASFLVPFACCACLAGLGIGLWTILQGAGPGDLLLRGGLAFLIVGALSFAPVLILSSILGRTVRELDSVVRGLSRGELPAQPDSGGVGELRELHKGLFQLGAWLEKERKEAAEERTLLARQSREDALQRLTNGVAREVQKPLAGVIGFAEIALRQPGVDGQLKNYLTMIEQEARSGREALERVLRFGRDEPFSTEPLDLNELLVEVSRSLLSPVEGEHIRFKMNLSDGLPKVLGDSTQLMQVFAALLDNARESMLPQGGVIEVSTNTEASGKVVVIVKDDGRGISAQDVDKVFTPFFTSKGNRKGAGLSLAIAASIIRRHEGQMDFYSTPGDGTVFFVHLPPDA